MDCVTPPTQEYQIYLGVAESLLTFPIFFPGGFQAEALVDTGSSICLMREDILNALGLKLESCFKSVKGLGLQTVSSVGSTSVDLQIGEVTFCCTFIVMPTEVMRHPVILGGEFFKDHSLVIDVVRSRITCSASWGVAEFYLKNSVVHTVYRSLSVSVSQNTVVPYSSTVFVPIQFPSDVTPDPSHEFYFDGMVLSPYMAGEPGVLSVGSSQLGVLLCKVAGSFSSEKLLCGRKIATLSSVIVTEPTDYVVNIAYPGSDTCIFDSVDLSHLCTDERSKVLDLMRSKVAAFSQGEEDVGCAGVTQHNIELYDDTPIRQKPRRFPEPVARELE